MNKEVSTLKLWNSKKLRTGRANQTIYGVLILNHKENILVCKHGWGNWGSTKLRGWAITTFISRNPLRKAILIKKSITYINLMSQLALTNINIDHCLNSAILHPSTTCDVHSHIILYQGPNVFKRQDINFSNHNMYLLRSLFNLSKRWCFQQGIDDYSLWI